MKTSWTISGINQQVERLTYRASDGSPKTISPVLTVKDVCRRLRKSRRQVYRYLRMGRLRPCGRVLGQWLFAPEELARWTSNRLPRPLRVFFWDVPFLSLSRDHHRDFVLGRLLESGDREAIRWVFRAYPRDVLVTFLKDRGAAVLSRRSWHFWATHLGISRRHMAPSSWRRSGRSWGGIP